MYVGFFPQIRTRLRSSSALSLEDVLAVGIALELERGDWGGGNSACSPVVETSVGSFEGEKMRRMKSF